MNESESCPTCGAPAVAGASACAACGRIVAAQPKPAIRILFGMLAGLVVGCALILPLVTGSAAFETMSGLGATLPIVVSVEAAALIACVVAAVALLARGKPGMGAFVLTAAIVAFLPVMACDAIAGQLR